MGAVCSRAAIFDYFRNRLIDANNQLIESDVLFCSVCK